MPAKDIPNHGIYKKWQGYPCRLFFLCTIFGLKPTRMIFPQCLHFISSTTFPGGISSMSKIRRPHFGFGHFTFSIDHRLPALIWNKGTSLPLPVPFYHLCFIGFSHSFFARTTLNFHSIDTIANIYLLSNFYSCFLPSFFTHIKTTTAVAIRNSAKSIS